MKEKPIIITVKDAEEMGWWFHLDGWHPYRLAWRPITFGRAIAMGLIQRYDADEMWERFIEIALVEEPEEGSWRKTGMENPKVKLTRHVAFARWGTPVARAATRVVFGEPWHRQHKYYLRLRKKFLEW